ncbi:MAG TPA: MerR family transcriptional regulator [Myxococcota bacterium]|nr:MerR family transcriptional regulator [Myxococcota bacterium]
MSYRIKTVAELVGVPRPTLVAWERRFNILEPNRTDAGYRVYSEEDVRILLRIRALLDGGLRISEAVEQERRERRRLNLTPLFPPAELPENARALLVQALLSFDRSAAEQLVVSADAPNWEQVLDDVYLPALREIGDLWCQGQATVAQEHFASTFILEQVTSRFHVLNAGPAGGTPAACVCSPGEQHALAMFVVATRLAARGLRVTVLGADLPMTELCVWLVKHQVDLVCITVHMRQDNVIDLARQVRSHAHPETIVALGGPGVAGLESQGTSSLWFHTNFTSFWNAWEQVEGREAQQAG